MLRWPEDFGSLPGSTAQNVALGFVDFDERPRHKIYFDLQSDTLVDFALKGDNSIAHVKRAELCIGEYPVWEAEDVPMNTPFALFNFPGIPMISGEGADFNGNQRKSRGCWNVLLCASEEKSLQDPLQSKYEAKTPPYDVDVWLFNAKCCLVSAW
jgi:hypothetical protein